MLELLSPAGSQEALVAAVQNGADAVYLGFGEMAEHPTSAASLFLSQTSSAQEAAIPDV